jgi:hypothetical protein
VRLPHRPNRVVWPTCHPERSGWFAKANQPRSRRACPELAEGTCAPACATTGFPSIPGYNSYCRKPQIRHENGVIPKGRYECPNHVSVSRLHTRSSPVPDTLFRVLRGEVCRGKSPEVPSAIDPAIRNESAKTAGNKRSNQCAALVGGVVSCCYRPRT